MTVRERADVGGASPAEPPTEESTFERRIKLFTGIVAPTTVFAALLFYYGYVTTAAEFGFFGISMGSLGFTYQDLLLKSVGALYVPLGALLVLVLGVVWGHIWLSRAGTSRWGPRFLHRAALCLAGVGALVFARGVVGVVVPSVARTEWIALSPVCLGLGITCLAYSRYLFGMTDPTRSLGGRRPWIETVGTVVVCGLVVLSLFWAANSFAAAYGRGRAVVLSARLAEQPAVVLDTADRLFVQYQGVEETRLPGTAKQQFRYRYRGLRLLVEADGRLFLVPERWQAGDGATLVVRADDDVRLQFYRSDPG